MSFSCSSLALLLPIPFPSSVRMCSSMVSCRYYMSLLCSSSTSFTVQTFIGCSCSSRVYHPCFFHCVSSVFQLDQYPPPLFSTSDRGANVLGSLSRSARPLPWGSNTQKPASSCLPVGSSRIRYFPPNCLLYLLALPAALPSVSSHHPPP